MNLSSDVAPAATTETAADWYKDAVIYQLHVKAFQDSNGDGIGDFGGLMQRLDHVENLGATAVWLLPFYPSPLRDDGYDISEYEAINPSYGNMDDFQAFVDEAHRRGLKVITELVINHTSDQHPWFQRARQAPPGSPERDFYVWSDDPGKWAETRIIFNDTEESNWTWDPVAGAYFWHRFYSHQPDLNFDNAEVLRKVLQVMHFWLDKGVDGLRLDAIPYLVERDGTNNENLQETHDVLKAIRANLDQHYSGRMLLAEANQWPEDTRPYFGEGDECHMGFHFPLMPRMYMALAQEDRHALTDILRQTPDIPDECQWGIFLRNHDELTLEMVTDRERDYLWNYYAADKRARINMGIRRRLAPLMQNDRARIELLNFLLFSMPGTPILYYGDEIGMGDNYYLGDRDGVRTPMQWSADRNAGFSRAAPQALYLPTIQDPVYGYEAVNVEAQHAAPSSLLNWMSRMIAVRQRYPVFGRGTLELIYPLNRKVLAYLRRFGDQVVLCVANLSRQAQAAEIDLSEFEGSVPVELTGRSPFPPIGELPYLLTMPAHGFYWFLLTEEAEAPEWHTPYQQTLPELMTLTTRDGSIESALNDATGRSFTRDVLPRYLRLQRWFAGKGERMGEVRLIPLAALPDGAGLLTRLEVEIAGETQAYFMPLSVEWGEEALAPSPRLPATLAKVRRANRVGALIDGAVDQDLGRTLLGALRSEASLPAREGTIDFRKTTALDEIEEAGEPRVMTAEQSNASLSFGDKIMMKIYRRLRTGVQPDVEIARFLTEHTSFQATPSLLGAVDLRAEDGTITTLAAATSFVANQGDAWSYVVQALDRELEALDYNDLGDGAMLGGPLDLGRVLGRRTAELHAALGSGEPGTAFAPEPITSEMCRQMAGDAAEELDATLDRLAARLGELPDAAAEIADEVLQRRGNLHARLGAVAEGTPSGAAIRVHGDYHLGQVLIAQNDVVIIDFEGEPSRPLAARQAKSPGMRDVAGMLRSFDYALWSAVRRRIEAGAEPGRVTDHARRWRDETSASFLSAYREVLVGNPTAPNDKAFAHALLDLFLVQKAAYEVEYEMAMRPDWIDIPLLGLLSIADAG